MKIILDTNVFVSGIFWSDPPAQILSAWRSQQITLSLTPAILSEYIRVVEILEHKYPSISVGNVIDLIAIHSNMHEDFLLPTPVSRDADDDKFIACAISANIKHIVSGDKDLLDISGYAGIEVVKPAAFIEQYL